MQTQQNFYQYQQMPAQRGVGAICNELLESPYIGQFADENNHELISQSEKSSQQSEYSSDQKDRSARHRKKHRHAEKRD